LELEPLHVDLSERQTQRRRLFNGHDDAWIPRTQVSPRGESCAGDEHDVDVDVDVIVNGDVNGDVSDRFVRDHVVDAPTTRF
ncbi:MAG: hypothetical protein MUE69_29270, partial [Myxococcota bacterium]|nr:hypothetical protein [Myxococcota bacterium]